MQNSNQDTYSIEIGSKVVLLSITNFDTDIDVDEITKIQHHNIIGEVLTCSTLLNRVGNLLAEMVEVLSESKLDFEIFKAQMAEKKRKELTFEFVDEKGKPKINKPTLDEVEYAIIATPEYKIKKKNMFRIQKEHDYINSLYWAMKDKCDKIQKLTDKLRPEDFEKEIVEGEINGILIKVKDKAIK